MAQQPTSELGHGEAEEAGRQAPAWQERYLGGSAEAERVLFERWARQIMLIQIKNRKRAGARAIERAFQAKGTFAVDDAELRFLHLPPQLRAGFAQPGAAYRTMVRFSNAAGTLAADRGPDLRSVALRIMVSPDQQHDLLMTNYPTNHARDARQFMEFAVATAGGGLSRFFGLVRLAFVCGPFETLRMLRNVQRARRRKVASVATETYWSRGAIRWGDTLAVQYLLRPAPGTPPAPEPAASKPAADDPDLLTHEAVRRLAAGDVRFELCVQRFADARSTPIEDMSVAWRERVSPVEPVAVLTIARRDASGQGDVAEPAALHSLNFNPWNTTELFRPLGNLNRVRKSAYDASAAHRLQMRWVQPVPLRNAVVGALARSGFGVVNRFVQWHRLGFTLGLLNLGALRQVLRRENLIDAGPSEAPPRVRPVPPVPDAAARSWRSFDGRYTDLSVPAMGATGTPFGRNLPPDFRPNLFDEPNPVVVSRELLYRETFRPATSLNLLAAAWIQFQVHDWVAHARHPLGTKDVVVPLPAGMTGWANTPDGQPETQMRIAGNIGLDDDWPDGTQRGFANTVSHWWDGSEVYGADEARAESLREGAKLRLTDEGYLPRDLNGLNLTGFNESWWLGLSALHTLFAREHNVLCDELRSHYRGWSDLRVYHTARLIVAALIAKIHTVEWTPAILGTRTLDAAMKTNWYGAQDRLSRFGFWLTDIHAVDGIPSSYPDHHGFPYSLTEDFTTVYRMHPLLPDHYVFRDSRTGQVLARRGFLDIQGFAADEQLRTLGLENVLYSCGVSYPGAITLHNFPRSLQEFVRDGERIDLSVVDLVRTRRRGVPRYNDFRAGLHMPRIRRWDDLCADPESVRRLREVYHSIDEVDTVVGLFAETPPDGFGFSDTAFRIFLLMASRRLQSDRFFTVDFRPEVYSPLGMDWIAGNTMASVIRRHCPDLAAQLPRDASAFAPWRPVVANS
jgi:Animal haem peroxidase/Catalase